MKGIKGILRWENCVVTYIPLEVIKSYKSDTESVVYADGTLVNVMSCKYGKERTDQLNL